MEPKICLALPVKSSKLAEIQSLMRKALELKPNFIELRFDYMNDLSGLTEKFTTSIINTIKPIIPLIFTFRKYSEGGFKEITDEKRFDIIKKLLTSHPNYLDIEMNTETSVLKKIILISLEYEVGLIFSYHDFNATPNYQMGQGIIENFRKKLKNSMNFNLEMIKNHIFKLIFTAQSIEDNTIALELCKHFSKQNQWIISFCMGNLGTLSRVLCPHSGAYFTYASMEQGTAPGQINIELMKKLYALI